MQKGVWPRFSRSCNKDRIFSLSRLDSLTPKTYPWEIFSKNSDGKAKIQGVVPTPLGVRRWIFTLSVWRLKVELRSRFYLTFPSHSVFPPHSCQHGRNHGSKVGGRPYRGRSPRKSGGGVWKGAFLAPPRHFLEFRTSNRSVWCIVETRILK